MADLRKQAEERAVAALKDETTWYGSGETEALGSPYSWGSAPTAGRIAANAASDVWEAILRPLVEAQPHADVHDCGYDTCIFCWVDEEPRSVDPTNPDFGAVIHHKDDCVWRRAKEALG